MSSSPSENKLWKWKWSRTMLILFHSAAMLNMLSVYCDWFSMYIWHWLVTHEQKMWRLENPKTFRNSSHFLKSQNCELALYSCLLVYLIKTVYRRLVNHKAYWLISTFVPSFHSSSLPLLGLFAFCITAVITTLTEICFPVSQWAAVVIITWA